MNFIYSYKIQNIFVCSWDRELETSKSCKIVNVMYYVNPVDFAVVYSAAILPGFCFYNK